MIVLVLQLCALFLALSNAALCGQKDALRNPAGSAFAHMVGWSALLLILEAAK